MSAKNTRRIASWLFCLFLDLALSRASDDIILGGIFSEHYTRTSSSGSISDQNNQPCAEHLKRATTDRLAMEFAVSEINHSGDILPGIRLGVNMKDSCNDLDYAINNTLDYEFIKTRFVNKSFQCSPEERNTKCCLDRVKDVPLVAIIAGAYSHIVKAVVNLVGLFKVPVIGYSSTSPSLNKLDYFLRTVAPDTVSTEVMVDLIQQLNWNIVLVIYVDNDFGHYAADCFRTAIRRIKKSICIAYDEKFSANAEKNEIKRVVEGIKKVKRSHVIAFFGTIEDFVYFQEHSRKYFDPNEYVWISSEFWIRSDLVGISGKIKHILAIVPEQGYPRDRFTKFLRSRAEVNTTCPHLQRNITKYRGELSCNRSTGENCTFERSKYIPLVIDAVYTVAMAMHNMLGCEAGKRCHAKPETIRHSSLLKYLKNLNFFNDLTNQTISFDSDGNPRSVRFTVTKLEVGDGTCKETPIGRWTCFQNTTTCNGSLIPDITRVVDPRAFNSSCGPTCNAGQHKSVEEKYPDCCWECKNCTGNKYSSEPGQFSCAKCQPDRWPVANHTSCEEIEHDYLDIASAPGALILAWNCLAVAVMLLVGVVFLKFSSSHIVRASSRQLSLLLLLGISMDVALLMTLLVEPNVGQCIAIFVLSHVSNCLVTGTLFLKTNRIHRIFRKSAMTERPRCLGNTFQLSIILLLVLIEGTLAATVLVFKPENGEVRVTYVMQGDNKKAFLLCNFFGTSFENDLFHVLIWSYDCGLIFICTYQAYLVRKVPENYNEARYITFTMVTISMNIIVYVITTSGMTGKNLVLVYCIFQSVKSSVALGCMFLPKVYVILFQPEKNVPHNPVQSKLGTFVEDRAVVRAKPGNSVSSGSSVQPSDSSEFSTGGTASTTTRGRSYRKVGAKVEQSVEEEFGERSASVIRLDDLRAPKQNVTSEITADLERSARSADIVLVNSLASSSSTA